MVPSLPTELAESFVCVLLREKVEYIELVSVLELLGGSLSIEGRLCIGVIGASGRSVEELLGESRGRMGVAGRLGIGTRLGRLWNGNGPSMLALARGWVGGLNGTVGFPFTFDLPLVRLWRKP